MFHVWAMELYKGMCRLDEMLAHQQNKLLNVNRKVNMFQPQCPLTNCKENVFW